MIKGKISKKNFAAKLINLAEKFLNKGGLINKKEKESRQLELNLKKDLITKQFLTQKHLRIVLATSLS